MLRRIDRRTFLKYSIVTSVVWTGWNVPREAGLSVAEAAELFQVRATGQTAAVWTDADRDYVVKTQLDEVRQLRPWTTYYYRFIYRGTPSAIGRFKTLPRPNDPLAQVRFGFISCQDYVVGYYNALSRLAE